MNNEAEIESNVPGIGTVYSIDQDLPFDDFLEQVGSSSIPSIRQIAYSRMYDPSLANKGITVREGIVYPKNRLPIIALNAPFLDEPKKAANAQRNDVEYEVDTDNFVKLATKQASLNPLEREVLFVPFSKDFKIPRSNIINILPKNLIAKFRADEINSDNLDEVIAESMKYLADPAVMKKQDPITQFAVGLFKDTAVAYALFSPYDFSVKLVEKEELQKYPRGFSRELFFNQLKHSSAIEGFNHYLHYGKKQYFIN